MKVPCDTHECNHNYKGLCIEAYYSVFGAETCPVYRLSIRPDELYKDFTIEEGSDNANRKITGGSSGKAGSPEQSGE